MKVKWNGVEFGKDCYIYWFDLAEVPQYRRFGKQLISGGTWYCFWWFNVGFKLK